MPWMLPMFTMLPRPASAMASPKARCMSMTPVAFTRMDSSHCPTLPFAHFIGRSTELFTSPCRHAEPLSQCDLQREDGGFIALIEPLGEDAIAARGLFVRDGLAAYPHCARR